ncbi:alpha/beta hydrolase [Actinokineospora pegani]|uniref:alpha/beta hydrolase n=1 Tax=Actinokineospora pegani TaxID=2654637 RepID=UPI001F3678F6|nr:alpha/beta hydrolase [Actinokineospora pegani]
MVAAGLVGSMAAAAPAAAQGPAAQVRWGACPEDVKTGFTALECGTVRVPLDYAEPDGTQIELMLSRIASAVPDQRRGVLMLNPGGPGGSGLSMPADLVGMGLPASVMNAYDVIGMDTRGVGHSTPLSCGFTADQEYRANIPPYAVDEAAVDEQAEISQGVAAQCAANDPGGELRHLSTANTARDLDRIRAALGEEKTNYLGYSYGTALGAAYASMFPERADRVVLDSNLPDTFLDHEGMRTWGAGAEETFPDFAAWAARRHGAYGLGSTPEQVRATYFEIARQLDENPVPGLSGSDFRMATFVGLYGKTRYGTTAQIWQSLLESDADAAKRQLAATPELSPNDNAFTVFLSVTCNDINWPEDVQTYQRDVAEDRERFPLFGAATANIIPCAYWEHEPVEPPVRVNPEGSEILILQNLRDPVTPHRGAVALQEKFGERSHLVSVDGSGHGVYVFGGNACALNTTTAYLVDGELPAKNKLCEA